MNFDAPLDIREDVFRRGLTGLHSRQVETDDEEITDLQGESS
jgi:hypothetical protein